MGKADIAKVYPSEIIIINDDDGMLWGSLAQAEKK